MPGAKNLQDHEGVKTQVKDLQKTNWLPPFALHPMVLGSMGLLKGKRATCYPGFEPELIEANHYQRTSYSRWKHNYW